MRAAAEERRLVLSAYVIHTEEFPRENLMEDIIDKIMTILVHGLISFINNLLLTFLIVGKARGKRTGK